MPLVLTEKTGINLAVDGGNLDVSADAADILTLIKTVDGAASGLDADLLDGLHGSGYATAAQGALAETALQTGDTVTVAVGSEAAPGLSFTGDLNSGLYRVTNDVLAIVTGATERLRISASGLRVGGAEALTLVEILVLATPGTSSFVKADYPWLKYMKVYAIGGGGAGGGAATTGAGQASAGGGGGAGASIMKTIDSAGIALLPASATVDVGAGGAGSAGAAGAAGGQSRFEYQASVFAVAGGGGAGGLGSAATPPARSGTNGSLATSGGALDMVWPGQSGNYGVSISSTLVRAGDGGSPGGPLGGSGGVGYWATSGANGEVGRGYGAGGSGGRNTQSNGTSRAGGDGGNGVVVIELYA